MNSAFLDLGLGHIQFARSIFSEVSTSGAQYGNKAGWTILRELVAQRENTNSDEVILTTGASMGLVSTLATMGGNGSVLCPLPYYPAYPGMLKAVNLQLIPYKLIPENNWLPDPNEIQRIIRPDTKAIIINFPGNPTGSVPSSSLFNHLVSIAQFHDILIISDEVYADHVYGDLEKPWEIFDLNRQKVVRIKSFSKTFGMPGERLGYILASSYLADKVASMHWKLAMSPPAGAQDIAFRILTNKSDQRITQLRNQLNQNRDLAYSILNDSNKFKTLLPNGGIFLWVQINSKKLNGEALSAILKNEYGVITVPGIACGDEFENYFRVSFGVESESLVRGIRIIRKFGERL